MEMGELMGFVLVLVRVATVFAFLPFLGEGTVPAAIKALAAVVMSLALAPLGSAAVPVLAWQPIQFFLYVAAEVLFGALLGASAMLVFKALRIAGEMVGQQMGMALAVVADPLSGVEATPIGNFCETVGVLVFFVVRGHHWMLRALHESFVRWPLGAFLAPEFVKGAGVGAVASGFGMAFQLAAPLLLLGFTVSLVMAVMARLVPEVNVLIVGFPLRIGVGFLGLTLFVPVLVNYSGEVARMMGRFMAGVAGGG